MKILIDDFRLLTNGEQMDIVVRNYKAAHFLIGALIDADMLATTDLYVDHDLGSEDNHETGYDLICMIEAETYHIEPPRSITCVSDNGAGRTRMQLAIDKIYKEYA